MTFLYSTISGPENVPAQNAAELIGIARGLPMWDALIVVAENQDYPRVHISWHDGHGFIVHCFEDGESWGFFLTEGASFSSPEVEIEMGGQALEKWPRQLFVESERVLEALDFFLHTGQQKGQLHWVRTDGFPREIVWEGREGRDAWEKSQETAKAIDLPPREFARVSHVTLSDRSNRRSVDCRHGSLSGHRV
jgi:hypothetical protein